ncbi:MAG: hypothetical protein L7F78_25225 [Syntrophales bacterium LBB04]|nr:hypothetical protein [Syntrophales bacterium LBB04]
MSIIIYTRSREVGRALGNFMIAETPTVGRAIIHHRIVVVDPLNPVNCMIAFGSRGKSLP